jgi:hypothetical protein
VNGFAYISVQNSGGYVASFFVDAQVPGPDGGNLPFHGSSGNYPNGNTKSVQIPAEATDITITIKDERAVNDWHTMHKQRWPDTSTWPDGTVKFELTGTTFHEHCKLLTPSTEL